MRDTNQLRAIAIAFVFILGMMIHATNAGVVVVDPDDFPHGTDVSLQFPGVAVSLLDGPGASGQPPVGTAIYAFETPIASTGSNAFAFLTRTGEFRPHFVHGLEDLMIEFDNPVSFVSVDFITDDTSDPGILEVYDVLGNLLEAVQTPGAVGFAGVEAALIDRPQNDIAFAVAAGVGSQAVYIDHIQYSAVPEPASLVLWACGLGAILCLMRRMRQN